MHIATIVLTVLGLCLFEIVSSIDNAVINAEILGTMDEKSRKWFLLWGFIIAIVLVRGLLPWAIIWATVPSLGPIGAFTAALSGSATVRAAVEAASPVLLAGGGVFLLFLFFQWLFLEEKQVGLRAEKFFERHGVWFFAVVSVLLAVIVHFALGISSSLAFGAVIGSTAFFIMHGFKQNAEKAEKDLIEGTSNMSSLSKILYLEIIDATFSVDGVLGAFAFTLSVPLILIGNGIGAFILRKLTVGNMDTIKQYAYLKNGAMYSICALGIVMLSDAFGAHIPEWVSPVMTVVIISYFYFKSKKLLVAKGV